MPTMSAPPLLTPDHLDLLITAALRWDILTAPTSPTPPAALENCCVAVATPDAAARLLQQENLAALRWLTDRGRSRPADRAVPHPHTYTAVDVLNPVEVIKACHAYEHICAASPGWAGSAARRLVAAIGVAAAQRLDGYAEAPWMWTRPRVRAGRPVAVGGRWRPDLPGCTWIEPADLIGHWGTASFVVVTVEAAARLPAALPSRAGVFLLAADEPPDTVWEAVNAAAPETVLYWPHCHDWLAGQAADPAPEYTNHREGTGT